MRLLVTDAPVEVVAERVRRRDVDIVWHVEDRCARELRELCPAAYGTDELLPDGGMPALQQEIIHWLDAIGGGTNDERSLRALTFCDGYSLWEPVRQSTYANVRSGLRTDRLLIA